MSDQKIRDAATTILLRDAATAPKVLMGQRGAKAAFMPNKFVFPGGAVDPVDADVTCVANFSSQQAINLKMSGRVPGALVAAAIRELWEETGLILGQPGPWDQSPPADWQGFCDTGHVPDASALQFVFRAITPPGRPRRFDARFFLANADHIANDLDDFSMASDELSHLHWIALGEARSYNLPFITEVVLSEVAKMLPDLAAPQRIPFFDNSSDISQFRWMESGET